MSAEGVGTSRDFVLVRWSTELGMLLFSEGGGGGAACGGVGVEWRRFVGRAHQQPVARENPEGEGVCV
jgi:hypothetical protein